MSWEESDPVQHRCPCGKGHYAVVHRSDDWGRFEERWAMECPSCRQNYALHARHVNRKGIVETHYGWVPKSLAREAGQARAHAQKKEQKLAAFLRKNFAKRWQEHFAMMSKKAAWAELTENGKRYPSLATFYDHVRRSGLQQVLDRYLQYREVEAIVRILESNDKDLRTMVEEMRALEREIETKERQLTDRAVV